MEMERLFAADMTEGEAQMPPQTSAKQKAWVEKAKSTIASLQGERKIRPFFNFTPTVSILFPLELVAQHWLIFSHASS